MTARALPTPFTPAAVLEDMVIVSIVVWIVEKRYEGGIRIEPHRWVASVLNTLAGGC